MVTPVTAPAGPARAAAGMGVATAVSRGFGFLRVLVIAAVLGTTYLGNTFQASNSVSNVLFELLAAGALSAVLVPTFVRLLDRGEHGEAERLANGLLGLSLLALGAVAAVGVIAAPWLARLLSSGVDDPTIAAQQEHVATFLLRFFVPQVLLYALGAIAIAVLYAKRRFVITALAPIGNTVVLVAALVVFRQLHGAGPADLDLTTGEKLALALGGTLGVLAFVAVPVAALWRDGFLLRPRLQPRDPAVRGLLRLSGWAVLQHAGAGLLLGAAIVVGNGVAGGVVAYQVAFVFFLAPYAILAQPIHTAILPDLAREAARSDRADFGASLRWALDGMAVLVVPVSAALLALAEPTMRVFAFGKAADGAGVSLLAAGLASLALGLYAYGAFLLLARAHYALGDSRTPALVALGTALLGVAVMVGAASLTHGAARVAALGIGHSVAYVIGSVVLAVGLSRRTGELVAPRALPRALGLSALLGLVAWRVVEAAGIVSRPAGVALLAMVSLAGAGAYVGGLRLLGGGRPRLRPVAGRTG